MNLDIHDLLALPDRANQFLKSGAHQLLVTGNSGDSVHSSGQGWGRGANLTVAGEHYAFCTHADIAAQLSISLDIAHDIG